MKKILIFLNSILVINLTSLVISCYQLDTQTLEMLSTKIKDELNEVDLKITNLQKENNSLESQLQELKNIEKISSKFEPFTRLYDKANGYRYKASKINLPIKNQYFKIKIKLNKFKNNQQVKELLNDIQIKENQILNQEKINYQLKQNIENTKEELSKFWGYGINPVYNKNQLVKIGYFLTRDFEIQIEKIKPETNQVPDHLPKEITSLKLAFQQNINSKIKGIENWKTDNIKNMSEMFESAKNFNQDISNWNTSNVIKFNSMFNEAEQFNQNLSNWKTNSAINMDSMFVDAKNFNNNNQKLIWNTKNVTNMRSMFLGASMFNQDISKWDVSNVTNMSNMFFRATSFNQNISNWNVLNVTNMSRMFFEASSFDQDLSKWKVNKNVVFDDFAFKSKIDNDNKKLPNFNN
ncbi:BspA family leucine-rich repeat surface protein [Mycoplasma mycoides subsp. capri]|uniref:BspA family leucine-rich repeat surface protein n=1 Tax=Mycoplasma mycoides TaxID=2102 RepID=UPI0022403930|nr:BspA family leucine-rich repeat surface protein [Mycoplasma mycoides]QVK02306.1 BspA family leucine-rich repeat surface protein [Mycoplasma mycoides subsp. capri]